MKKLVSLFAVILVVIFSITGCSFSNENKATTNQELQPGPEVGKWYGLVNISDLSLSKEDQTIVSLLAGNVAYEMDVEFCEDNTYSYVMNMDKFREEIQKSASTILGFFTSFNLDLFVDRIVDLVLDSYGATERSSYGSYTVDEDGLITAIGSDTQYFRYTSGTLHQLNEEGQIILTFTKAE